MCLMSGLGWDQDSQMLKEVGNPAIYLPTYNEQQVIKLIVEAQMNVYRRAKAYTPCDISQP